MAKYRKRPRVIEAEQWFPGRHVEGVVGNWDNNPMMHGKYSVHTLSGWVDLLPGDWVITDNMGEQYPCKDEVFRMTYEPVEDREGTVEEP